MWLLSINCMKGVQGFKRHSSISLCLLFTKCEFMLRLDSNKIQFPISCLDHIDKTLFIDDIANKSGQCIKDKLYISAPCPGLKKIEINYLTENVILDMSAKILKDDYLKSISINNISQVLDNINSLGLIKMNSNKVIDEGTFMNIDITQNIAWTDTKISDLCKSIQIASINPKVEAQLYNTKFNSGVTLIEQLKTKKVRLIMYDKNIELQLSKNKDFFKSCNSPSSVLNQSKNILRCETNNTEFKTIQKRLKIDDLKILSVLNSNINANYNLFNHLLSSPSSEQIELFNKYDEDESINHIIKTEGMRTIIIQCGYDSKLIKSFIQKYCGTTSAHYHWKGRTDKKGRLLTKGFYHLLQDERNKRFKLNSGASALTYLQKFNELLKVA